ncbi:glycoside hydrolase family 43 protein [Sphingobium sp.]|uniref:glycoside hydrolase family 43 protein n=1 Tax=Sphingobium sp. TaxID=1912891 RepID=UPI003B3B4B21
MRALLAALLIGLAVPAAADDAPLLTSHLRIHDPFVVAEQGSKTYWLFSRNDPAVTGDRRIGIMAYASTDLAHWQQPKLVFALPDDSWANEGGWAPEVHRWQGRWYLFATFHNEKAAIPSRGRRPTYRRATLLAVSDRIDGPYTLINRGEPVAPATDMTLDGTLHVDAAGRPWLVHAHEWLQMGVGTMEAMPLKDDLSPAGKPRILFRANEADWVLGQKQPEGDTGYVTDGPQLFRTQNGTLLMLWSSWGKDGYVQAQARSKSGTITGPWEQLGPLVERDSGHGMLFRAFDGRLMLILHRPFKRALAKFYEMRDAGDRVEVAREAVELDGEAYPTHGCPMGGKDARC